MWTKANRPLYDRSHLRYESNLTEEEWAVVERLLPPRKKSAGKRSVDMRSVFEGIQYILSTGCQWRALPKDFPPWQTVYGYFSRWSVGGVWERIHDTLRELCRVMANRGATPTVGIIDSQSVKSAEKGGSRIDPPGYDAGKKIMGKKRHILVDTLGHVICAIVHPADIQDRDGGIMLFETLSDRLPSLEKLYADGAYRGPIFANAVAELRSIDIEIVKRSEACTFVVLPKRWIVERTIGWLNRCRRLAKDWECLNEKALAFVHASSIRFMVRKLCIAK